MAYGYNENLGNVRDVVGLLGRFRTIEYVNLKCVSHDALVLEFFSSLYVDRKVPIRVTKCRLHLGCSTMMFD